MTPFYPSIRISLVCVIHFSIRKVAEKFFHFLPMGIHIIRTWMSGQNIMTCNSICIS